MSFNEYMQTESENGSTEKLVDLQNIVKVDDEYEVALLDIMYNYTPFSLNQLKAKQKDSAKEAYELKFVLNVEYDGVYNESDHRHLLASSYNSMTRVHRSDFDIWNYQRSSSDKIETSIGITSVHKHNKGDLDINTVVQLLNKGIENHSESIKHVIGLQCRNTSGKQLLTTDRYFTLPKFEIDENRNLIYLHLPYYIHSVELSTWLTNLTNLPKVITRTEIPLPYAPLTNKALDFNMIDPIKTAIGNVNVVENQYKQDGLNIFVYCDLIEYQIVGSSNSPLLRLTSLDRSKKGINWRQCNELQYIPLKYHQFHSFTVGVRGEKGNPITSGKI